MLRLSNTSVVAPQAIVSFFHTVFIPSKTFKLVSVEIPIDHGVSWFFYRFSSYCIGNKSTSNLNPSNLFLDMSYCLLTSSFRYGMDSKVVEYM